MNIEVQGPKKSIEIPIGDGSLIISESIIMGWIIIAAVFILCLVLTKDLKKVPTTKRQVFAEYIVKFFNNLVSENMGAEFVKKYAPYIASVFIFALLGALVSLLGFRSMTADISVTATMAVMTFALITYHKIQAHGIGKYLLNFVNPLNIISELSTPVSMAIRLFGNIAGGMIITALIYAALGSASSAVYGLLGFQAETYYFNIFQVGIPAILSIYFDLFSGTIQSYVFIMLTMAYIKTGRE